MPMVAVFIFEIHFFHRSRSELPCLRITCAANDAAMQFGRVGKPRPSNANILHFSLGYTSNPEEPERWILSFTEDVVCAFPASLPSSLTWGNCGLCGEIHELLKSDDITKARKLIKDDPSLVIRKAEDGCTPLHLLSGEWLQSNGRVAAHQQSRSKCQGQRRQSSLASGGSGCRPAQRSIRNDAGAWGRRQCR
jgi:hypothetical protein